MLRAILGLGALLLATAVAVWPVTAQAHDASSWGGLFRSRNGGMSWIQASSGKVMGSALAVALDPADSAHLLLGTDSGLLGSRNGGRDWDLVAPDMLIGPVFAVSFASEGGRALAASATVLAESDDGVRWRSELMPVGASPTRQLLAGSGSAAFYLVGWRGLWSTEDGGASWSDRGIGLSEPITQLVISPGTSDRLLALISGKLWVSTDGGRAWQMRAVGLPRGQIDTLSLDAEAPAALWAGAANRVFHSENGGETWASVETSLPEADTQIRGIASYLNGDQRRIVLSTNRGLYVSRDGGMGWDLQADNLPGHIEAGPLIVDRGEPATLYAGFSVTPYDELWQRAASGSSALARLGAAELSGAVAFLIVVGLCAVVALRWLGDRTHAARLRSDVPI